MCSGCRMPLLTLVRHPVLTTLAAQRLIHCLNYSGMRVVVVTWAPSTSRKENGYPLYMQTKLNTLT